MAAEKKEIVVLLVGPPGSGKSTFCESVMKSSHRPWSRICQVFLSLSLYHTAHNLTDEIPQ